MFGEEVIHKLKKSNISKDAEKTKQRVEELYKAASKDDKDAIIKLSGISPTSIYGIYKSGSISVKLVVAIAQTLNVDPLFLTGEIDDKGESSDEQLRAFLISRDKTYEKILAENEPVKKQRKPKTAQKRKKDGNANATETPMSTDNASTPESTEADEAKQDVENTPAAVESQSIDPESQIAKDPEVEFADLSEDVKSFINAITEEQMIALMRSILLRAESGISKHAELAFALKKLLVTESV